MRFLLSTIGSRGEVQPLNWISVGETNHRALFPRVAAVVHHGGAGTTTTAAVAGTPQVVLPQRYDQPYWASRVEALGIGVHHAADALVAEALAGALTTALERSTAERAEEVARGVRLDGASVAADRLTSGSLAGEG